MNSFLGALSFLTTLPVPRGRAVFDSGMLKWFQAVGLILGLLWAGFDWVAGCFFSGTLTGCFDVLFLIILTGGLHLDGLADTADGLLSHRPFEDKLRIMKDSRIGSWGVLALITILAVKALAIADLTPAGRTALVLAPVFGRTAMLMGMGILPYGRGKEGIGHTLFGDAGRFVWKPCLGMLVPVSLVLGWPQALLALLAFGFATAGLLLWYKSSMGCITGDMVGAMGEIVETCVLVILVAGQTVS